MRGLDGEWPYNYKLGPARLGAVGWRERWVSCRPCAPWGGCGRLGLTGRGGGAMVPAVCIACGAHQAWRCRPRRATVRGAQGLGRGQHRPGGGAVVRPPGLACCCKPGACRVRCPWWVPAVDVSGAPRLPPRPHGRGACLWRRSRAVLGTVPPGGDTGWFLSGSPTGGAAPGPRPVGRRWLGGAGLAPSLASLALPTRGHRPGAGWQRVSCPPIDRDGRWQRRRDHGGVWQGAHTSRTGSHGSGRCRHAGVANAHQGAGRAARVGGVWAQGMPRPRRGRGRP